MRRLPHATILISCLALSVSLSGCEKKATGQVAAVVNGDEVTLQEVNAELGNANIPDGAQKEKARSAILQRLVRRTRGRASSHRREARAPASSPPPSRVTPGGHSGEGGRGELHEHEEGAA